MAKLTDKMLRFAEEYVKNGYNGAGAYAVAYGQDKGTVCASEAYKLLRDQRIIDEIENVEGSFRVLGQMSGIDKTTITKVLADMLVATKKDKDGDIVPDYTARKDAITLFGKLTGDFKERKELTVPNKTTLSDVNLNKLSTEELAEIERDLLSSL